MSPRCLAVWFVASLVAFPAAAQAQPHTVCRLPILPPVADGAAAKGGAPRLRDACEAPTARFEVDYDGFPADAERAFAAAVETWACRVASNVPIRIEAVWEPLGTRVLGSAGPFLVRNFPDAPVSGTWYGAPLANALSGRDLRADEADIDARFNSSFANWHLDPDTAPDANEFDLYTVVLHELGHGLGFIGNLDVRGGRGFVGGGEGTAQGPYIYDRFTEAADGQPLLSLGDGTAALADALQSATTFDGPASRAATGGPLILYAPLSWEAGGSYSHLAESEYGRGTPDGLMTPNIGRGETIDVPGTAVCALLADLGWTLTGDCAEGVGPVAPPGAALAVEIRGPNPVRDRDLVVGVSAAVPQQGRVSLVDSLGRVVARLYDGLIDSDEIRLRFDGAAVAAGTYLVVVETEGERIARGVTLLR